jgi:hypothetical protein
MSQDGSYHRTSTHYESGMNRLHLQASVTKPAVDLRDSRGSWQGQTNTEGVLE